MLHHDEWLKVLAPSTELRKSFHEGPEDRWTEFTKRYRAELESEAAADALARLRTQAQQQTITLLTATKDLDRSYLAVLQDYLE